MPITIVTNFYGEEELIAKLDIFGSSISDLSLSMNALGVYLSAFFAGEVFASRGQVIGEPWQALDPAYAAWKAKHWPGRPPLVQTGLMQRSFRYKSTNLSTFLYNEADYFKYHQQGTSRLPARVMMKIDETRQNRIVEVISADIERKQAQAGV